MPLMTTTTRHPFGAGFRNPGDTFEATADEAKTFTSLGWASVGGKSAAVAVKPAKVAKAVKTAKPAAKAATYRTRAMKARK